MKRNKKARRKKKRQAILKGLKDLNLLLDILVKIATVVALLKSWNNPGLSPFKKLYLFTRKMSTILIIALIFCIYQAGIKTKNTVVKMISLLLLIAVIVKL